MTFFKYQGTGNDFIIVDQFEVKHLVREQTETIQRLCDRRFGIGADGLILLEQSDKALFEMIYFNADGQVGSLCGNGSRCAVACSYDLGRFHQEGSFLASDGIHRARLLKPGYVEIAMNDVWNIQEGKGHLVMDTGSPHYISFVEDLSDLDIVEAGRAIRYSARFREKGINVNFVERKPNYIQVATYERGVEDETLSCGTGVTAAALTEARRHQVLHGTISVKTKGGDLSVKYERVGNGFKNIWLCGPVKKVFSGTITLA